MDALHLEVVNMLLGGIEHFTLDLHQSDQADHPRSAKFRTYTNLNKTWARFLSTDSSSDLSSVSNSKGLKTATESLLGDVIICQHGIL